MHYALFETPIGTCAIVWTEVGIRTTHLPEHSDQATRDRILRATPHAREMTPPPTVRTVITDIVQLLSGKDRDLSKASLDWQAVPDFHRKVYEAVSRIPPGQTTTYGGVARQIGSPKAARAVGQAMARNPLPLIIPCQRVVGSGGQPGGFSAYGGSDTKSLLLKIDKSCAKKESKSCSAQYMLANAEGLCFDPDVALAHLKRVDPVLKQLIVHVGDFRLQPVMTQSPFEALAESIVYQQLTGKAAATILKRVKELFREEGFFTPADILKASESELRSAGLSGAKTLALKDLALKTSEGVIPKVEELLALSDDEIMQRLIAIRGIGRWTVQMMLIFRFGKADVLPVDDYGVRKGFARVYGWDELPKPKELESIGENWRPYRTVASWYFWRALELPPEVAAACARKSKRR